MEYLKYQEFVNRRNYFFNNNIRLVQIDCEEIKNKEDIFTIFAKQLKFPDYFGRNWEAFRDCLEDLSWIKNVDSAIVIKNIDKLKNNILDNLVSILTEVSFYWANKNKVFVPIVIISEKNNFDTIKFKIDQVQKDFNKNIKDFPEYFGKE